MPCYYFFILKFKCSIPDFISNFSAAVIIDNDQGTLWKQELIWSYGSREVRARQVVEVWQPVAGWQQEEKAESSHLLPQA